MYDFYCQEILSGKTNYKTVLDTENFIAFHHTKPAYLVHIVVTPKKHIDSLTSLSDQKLVLEMMSLIREVAQSIVDETGSCRVVTNLGSYQDSKHLHWHLISDQRRENENLGNA